MLSSPLSFVFLLHCPALSCLPRHSWPTHIRSAVVHDFQAHVNHRQKAWDPLKAPSLVSPRRQRLLRSPRQLCAAPSLPSTWSHLLPYTGGCKVDQRRPQVPLSFLSNRSNAIDSKETVFQTIFHPHHMKDEPRTLCARLMWICFW